MGFIEYVFIAFAALILLILLFGYISSAIDNEKEKNKAIIERIKKEENNQIDTYKNLNTELEKQKNYYTKCNADFDKIIKERCKYYPQLAGIMADLLTLYYARSADYLDLKRPPAHIEATRIRELRTKTKKILEEKKIIEYKLAYIYEMYPNIDVIFDDGFNAENTTDVEKYKNDDKVRDYLSKDEYDKLSTIERNQLALNRYVANRKSKWQIGRDYEMYIGQIYERKGYLVEYSGILKRLEDMGRDIIAHKNDEIIVIQCKNWAKNKTIHEKHIFQLYGTVILYQIDTLYKVKGVFITTTQLSDKARRIANYLNIEIIENFPLENFPRIKCNINKHTQEKIYHLPFDQQYDRVIIEQNYGEFYALTVKEAEDKGFRRAFKHKLKN